MLESNVAVDREDFAWRLLSWFGAFVISWIGLTHLLQTGEMLGIATYLGFLFLANFVASSVAAIGIYWGNYGWAWLLGIAVAGGAFVGFVVSRVVGLPGYPEAAGGWFNLPGLIALMLEASFLLLSLLVVTSRGRALVGTEQGRIVRERLPPAEQETPEHFELIEKDMAGIRTRMAPDLSDLRKHVEPRAIKEQAKRSLRERLRNIPRTVKATANKRTRR